MNTPLSSKVLNATVVITGIGYLVDMFDLFLFNIVRTTSLKELGFEGSALTDAGIMVSNAQMAGLLLGAIIWGVVADKVGRKVGLLCSIALYSLGTLASAHVYDAESYALARFVTGVGLAGELGAGIALIAEKLNAQKRGYGVMVFICLGFAGVLLACIVAEFAYWRDAYTAGGIAGLLLLLGRISLFESGMFEETKKKNVKRGSFLTILKNPKLLKTYVCGILFIVPATFIAQVVWTLSPEIGTAMQVGEPVKANIVIGLGYSCVIIGDLLASFLSEKFKNRKKVAIFFLTAGIVSFVLYFILPLPSLIAFYALNALLGIAFGVWVIGVTWVAENFGTNVRGIVATTTPNFARGLTIPMNLAYQHMKVSDPLFAVAAIGISIFSLALIGWLGLKETHGKDLDYAEAG